MGRRMLPIGSFLTRSDNWVEPEPTQVYMQVTARLWGKGLKLRGRVAGSKIAAKRQVQVREGQFLLSRIDARHGAFGIVPAELDGALVSGDFPAFDIDSSQVYPLYLEWYSKTNGFVDLCRRASEGSTNRIRLKEERLLATGLYVPPLNEQRCTVSRLDRVAALVEERKRELAAADRDMDSLLGKAFEKVVSGADYLAMEEVAPLVRRPVEVQPDKKYPELGVRSFGRGTFHKPTLVGSQLTWQKLFRIHEGDLVFSNIKAWEGAFAVAEPEDDSRVGSHRYLTCVPSHGLATAHFICYYLRTPEGAEKVADASPGSADRNRTLGQAKLAAIEVPVPSIKNQRWFDGLQARARAVRQARVKTAKDLDALIPAMLHEVFGRESGCVVAA